jgi:hypothetical protein
VTLFRFEERWARAIGRALVPRGALGGALDDIDLGARYAHECAISPWYAALAFRASLWLTWLAPLWMLGRVRTFGGLDEATRVVVLERLLKHRVYFVRMAGLFLKLAICSLLLGDEATLARLGAYKLPPPLVLGKKSAS